MSASPSNRKVVFLVDNPLRDIKGLILIGAHCAVEGVDVYLVPMNLAYYNRCEEVLRLAPDLVIANYLRLNNLGFIDTMKSAGIPVAVLDTEGGVLVSCQSYVRNVEKLRSYYPNILTYFAWGPLLANFLIEQKVYTKDQIIISGCPRYDFYVDPWKQASKHFDYLTDRKPGPIILLNSNFPVVNPAFQTAANEREMLVKQHGYSEEEAVKMIDSQKQAMKDFTQIANTLAAEFPEATVVYRPHPFESEKTYHDLLDKRDNLRIIKKGTVDDWILNSACVIQRGCSTAIEAGIAGIPTFSPIWVPMVPEQPSAESVSIPCPNLDFLVGNVREVLQGSFTAPPSAKENLGKVISDWFLCRDGRAHHRVGDGILAALNSRNLTSNGADACEKVHRSTMRFSIRERLKGILGALLGLPPDWAWIDLKNGRASGSGKIPAWKQRLLAFWGFLFGLPRHHAWFEPHYGQWPAVTSWKNGPKAFTAQDVHRQMDRICAAAGGKWDGIKASECKPEQDYVFGRHAGVSVKIHK